MLRVSSAAASGNSLREELRFNWEVRSLEEWATSLFD